MQYFYAITLCFITILLQAQTYKQSFDDLEPTFTLCEDRVSSGSPLSNLSSYSINSSWNFETIWEQANSNETGPLSGSEKSDQIGVNNSAVGGPSVSPRGLSIAEGDYNYKFNDGDGALTLLFEALDLSTFNTVNLGFYYYVNATTWEGNDAFEVYLTDGSDSLQLMKLNATLLDTMKQEQWTYFETKDLKQLSDADFDWSEVRVLFRVINNAESENLFIDEVVLHQEIVSSTEYADSKQRIFIQNPVMSNMMIDGLEPGFKIEIIDSKGARLLDKVLNYQSITLNASAFNQGIYLLKVVDELGDLVALRRFYKIK